MKGWWNRVICGVISAAAIGFGPVVAMASPGTGFTLGDFRFAPAVSDGLTYTTNVRQDSSKVGDWRNDVLATLDVRSLWKTNALGLNAQVMNRSYFHITQQDNTLYSVIGDGRYDLSSRWHLSGAGKFLQNQVSRSDPNSIPGAAQATVSTLLGNGQLSYQGTTYGDHVVANLQHLSFSAAILPTGQQVVEQDQNRLEFDAANYFSRKFAFWKAEPYLYVSYNKINYDSATDATISGRNSYGEKVGVGANMQPSQGLKLEFTVGILHQIYDTSTIGQLVSWFGSTGLDWAVTRRDHVRVTFQRTFNEVAISGSPGYFMNDLSVLLTHEISKQYSVDIAPAFRYAAVRNYPLNVTQYAGTIRVNDVLSPNFVLHGQLFISANQSNNAQFAYHETAATVQLSYRY